MSLLRIFESAKKLGLPLIVTNTDGRDPMVILPLDQFEALAQAQEAPSIAEKMAETASPEVRSYEEMMPALKNDEISLEERFYLEPIDERS